MIFVFLYCSHAVQLLNCSFADLILFANLYWKFFIKVIFILIKNLYLKH